ncbi:MAG: hypothetical protein DRH49_03735 [Candidatus Coatesbacteria bacterium]|nr:MAG: hypothetical protein DRH49_03735 [Candidatus Coatesbacteria bacterium]
MKISLRVKLIVLIVLLIFIVAGLISGLVVRRINNVLLSEVQLRGEILARNLANDLAEPLMADDDLAPPSLAKEVLKSEGVLYCYVVDNENRLKAPTPKFLGEKFTPPEGLRVNTTGDLLVQEYESEGESIIDISVPVIFGGQKHLGYVYLGLSKKTILSVVQNVRYMIFTIASGGIFLGIMGAIGLAQFILNPIRKLVSGARAIGKGDFRYRVDVRTRDEMEELSRAFNEMAENLEKKELIEGAFRRYVSHQVADEILRAPGKYMESLKGLRREITIFFADIRGFTTFSERMAPEDVVTILNRYLTIMTDKVFQNAGTLDKFTGDGLMALFGAPLDDKYHAFKAVNCALDIKESLNKLYQSKIKEMEQSGFEYPRVGFGINSGIAVVGNIGYTSRLEYTAIGDPVNLANRLVDISEGGQVLVGEETYKLIRDYFDTIPMGIVKVKGKVKPVSVYQIVSLIRSPSQ